MTTLERLRRSLELHWLILTYFKDDYKGITAKHMVQTLRTGKVYSITFERYKCKKNVEIVIHARAGSCQFRVPANVSPIIIDWMSTFLDTAGSGDFASIGECIVDRRVSRHRIPMNAEPTISALLNKPQRWMLRFGSEYTSFVEHYGGVSNYLTIKVMETERQTLPMQLAYNASPFLSMSF